MLNMRSIPWECAILLFRCEAFGDVKLCFWWGKPFLQINGVLVPAERSWSSLKGVFPKKWCHWKDCYVCSKHGLTFKRGSWFIFFWWVKPFLQTTGAPSKEMAAGFRWKGVLHLFWRNGATFKHKDLLSFFEGNATSLEDAPYFDTISFLLFKLNCLNAIAILR